MAANSNIRVGQGKIDASRTLNGGALGLTNQDKLNLSSSGVQDLMQGIMEMNRALPQQTEQPPLRKTDPIYDLARQFSRIANTDLKKQDSSDAWNERANRLAAGRDSAHMFLRATMNANKPLPEELAAVMSQDVSMLPINAQQAYEKVQRLNREMFDRNRHHKARRPADRGRPRKEIQADLNTARKNLADTLQQQ